MVKHPLRTFHANRNSYDGELFYIFFDIFCLFNIEYHFLFLLNIYKESPPGYGIGFAYTFGFFIPSILYFLNLIISSFRSYLGYSKFEDFTSFIKSKSFYVSLSFFCNFCVIYFHFIFSPKKLLNIIGI